MFTNAEEQGFASVGVLDDAAVIVNEIMIHHPVNDMFEFVELFNSNAAASVASWPLTVGPFRLCNASHCRIFSFNFSLFFVCFFHMRFIFGPNSRWTWYARRAGVIGVFQAQLLLGAPVSASASGPFRYIRGVVQTPSGASVSFVVPDTVIIAPGISTIYYYAEFQLPSPLWPTVNWGGNSGRFANFFGRQVQLGVLSLNTQFASQDVPLSCPDDTNSLCSAGCQDHFVGDGVCDNVCRTAGCNWDTGRNSRDCCGNGFVEGVEQCDGGPCCSQYCTFLNSANTCREPSGACDVSEFCTGSSAWCPIDRKSASGTLCRNGFLPCDAHDYCDGVNGNCVDRAAPAGQICRSVTGPCSAPATCDGSSFGCPSNPFRPMGARCRNAVVASDGTTCDLGGFCNGRDDACHDQFEAIGTECRAPPNGCVAGSGEKCRGNGFPVCEASNAATRFDACNVCDGDGSTCRDCTGATHGTTVYDVCDVCGGNGRSCVDCAGVPNGPLVYDACGVCGGERSEDECSAFRFHRLARLNLAYEMR